MSKILKDISWPPENTKDLGSKEVSTEAPKNKFNTLAEALKKVKLGSTTGTTGR